jgi:hypothetical protein
MTAETLLDYSKLLSLMEGRKTESSSKLRWQSLANLSPSAAPNW